MVELGLLVRGVLGALALMVALFQNLDLLQLLERFRKCGTGVLQLNLEALL